LEDPARVGARRAELAEVAHRSAAADSPAATADVDRRDLDLLRREGGAHVGRALERDVRIFTPAARSNNQHQEMVVEPMPVVPTSLAGVRARRRRELLQRSNRRIAVHGEVARIVDDVPASEAVRAAELRRALDRDRHERRRVDEPIV